MEKKTYYTFEDIFIFPNYSTIESRSQVDTSCELGGIRLDVPIISSNMDTITGPDAAIAMYKAGGIGALHRFMSIEENVEQYKKVLLSGCECIVSVGASGDYQERARALHSAGARHFIVDVAHGHHVLVDEALGFFRRTWKAKDEEVFLIAGNVANPESIYDLVSWGADVIKVGVGNGAVCRTRLATGIGVPQFSCLLECAQVAEACNVKIIADGGIKGSDDLVKSLVAGSDYIMAGGLFAGCVETPGDVFMDQSTGQLRKVYRGMASKEAQLTMKEVAKHIEGISTTVPLKGEIQTVVSELKANLQSAMSYMDCGKLEEIPRMAKWGVQTSSGYREGTPHILLRN